MKIIGLDIATNTGFAYWDTTKHRSSIEVRSIRTPGTKISPEQRAWETPAVFMAVLEQFDKPDFAIIEMRPLRVFEGTNATTTPNLSLLHGAFMACLGARKINFQTIEDRSWRAAQYGAAQKGLDADGKKELAITLAKDLGIAVRNSDEAEAAQLVQWGATCSHFAKQALLRENTNG